MRPSIRTGLVVLSILAALAAAAEPSRYEEAIARFSAWAEERVSRDDTPGLSIGFARDGFVWAEGFGYSDLENMVPAKPESAYRLASVTKPMTAIGVLILAEQGKLDLDAEVQTYVPFYPEKPWPVTVRQVLGHLGGIPHYVNYDLEGHFKDHKNTEQSIAVFADFDLVGEPGRQYRYSSYGYNLLGAVIEGASGQPYGEFMREAVWGPLGMDDTRMDDPDAIIPNRVRGYRRGPAGLINSEFVNISSRFAAGGTRSTVIDLLKFGQGLDAGTVLAPETVDRMITPLATADGISTGYGFGWGVRPVNGRFAASHGGGQAETATYLLWLPDEKLTIAAAMNLEGGDRMTYVRRLYAEVMGEPWSPSVYAGDRAHQLAHGVMRTSWDWGMALAKRNGGPLTEDREQLKAAFAALNGALDVAANRADLEAAGERIRHIANPAGGDLLKLAGSWMAAQLATGSDGATLERLHRDGAIPFFHAYSELGKQVPKPYRLSRDAAKLVRDWNADWSRTWTAETQRLDLAAAGDVAAVTAQLVERFAGAAVYPDYWPQLEGRVETLARSGQVAQALAIAEAGRQLYPFSGGPHFYTALLRLGMGESDTAMALLREAGEHDPSYASPSYLNGWAYNLKSAGMSDLGLGLLHLAVALHPDNANLYDSIGEFHLDKGDREGARKFYRKALEIDPGSENAKKVLAGLE